MDFRVNGPLRTELEIVFIGFLQIKVLRINPENVMPLLRFAVDGLFMVYTLSSMSWSIKKSGLKFDKTMPDF